jgi:hypothetical protein
MIGLRCHRVRTQLYAVRETGKGGLKYSGTFTKGRPKCGWQGDFIGFSFHRWRPFLVVEQMFDDFRSFDVS